MKDGPTASAAISTGASVGTTRVSSATAVWLATAMTTGPTHPSPGNGGTLMRAWWRGTRRVTSGADEGALCEVARAISIDPPDASASLRRSNPAVSPPRHITV